MHLYYSELVGTCFKISFNLALRSFLELMRFTSSTEMLRKFWDELRYVVVDRNFGLLPEMLSVWVLSMKHKTMSSTLPKQPDLSCFADVSMGLVIDYLSSWYQRNLNQSMYLDRVKLMNGNSDEVKPTTYTLSI